MGKNNIFFTGLFDKVKSSGLAFFLIFRATYIEIIEVYDTG